MSPDYLIPRPELRTGTTNRNYEPELRTGTTNRNYEPERRTGRANLTTNPNGEQEKANQNYEGVAERRRHTVRRNGDATSETPPTMPPWENVAELLFRKRPSWWRMR